MAEGHFGGGGSVFWRIQTDGTTGLDAPRQLNLKHSLDNGVWNESGTDGSEAANLSKSFVIRILPRDGMSPKDFIRKFSEFAKVTEDGRVQFTLPIEKRLDPTGQYQSQIQIGWGRGAEVDPTRGAAI
jgi:hypothetical protein